MQKPRSQVSASCELKNVARSMRWLYTRAKIHRIARAKVVLPAVLVLLAAAAYWGRAAESANDQKSAIAKLEKLGGKLILDVRAVDLQGTNVNDADLACLEDLKRLQTLNLAGTKVGDAGLAHIAGLTELETLSLNGTLITNEGMVILQKLTKLRAVDLASTKVTEDGLENLQTLPNLQSLDLTSAPVTDEVMETLEAMTNLKVLKLHGTKMSSTRVDDLRKALPNCKISY
jgi:hypothetical protein